MTSTTPNGRETARTAAARESAAATRARPAAATGRSGGLSPLTLLLGLAAVKLLLHLGVNAFGAYGIFRDELYYLACADHPAFGYVDQPPLSIWLLAAVRPVLGDSLFAIRLLPAVAGAALVLVTGLIARELRGGRFAVTVAALCPLVAGQVLAASSIWSMNAFDLLLVALAALAVARLVRSGDPRYWIAIGLLLGLGLLNKVGVLWVGLGLAAGVVCTGERRWLRTPWPWAGAAISLLFFLPYLIWNALEDWAHLEFIGSAVGGKYSGLTAWSFLSGQLLVQNPVTVPVWLLGLAWLLFGAEGRRFRILGIVWLTAAVVLVANGQSKAGYLGNAYAPLFAAGGVAWERLLRSRPAARGVAVALLLSGLVLAPLATPLLPVESYVAYAAALGRAPSTDEGHELAELPQFYADMFGWRAKAEAVAAVYHALPEHDRARAAIFAENYGRAGAIDYWSDELGLPGAIGNHNSYWLWGPGDSEGDVVIVLGGETGELAEQFGSVEVAGRADCRWCIPYERNLAIHVCRGLRRPIGEVWQRLKHYD